MALTGIEILAKQGRVTTVSPTTRRRVTRYRTTRRASASSIVAPFPPRAGTASANVSGRYPGNLNQVGLRANADPGLVSCPERGRPGQHAVDLYPDVQPIDVGLIRPRSIGVEQVGLWALDQLGRPALAGRVGCQRRVAHRGGRRHRRVSGPAGVGARDAPLAARTQRP